MPKGSREGSDPIRSALFSEDDEDFIDFVEVSVPILFFRREEGGIRKKEGFLGDQTYDLKSNFNQESSGQK